MLRLAYMTGARIVHAPPWPGAGFTEEQPEPGAGIRVALALERAARAGVRVYIQRAREAGMSWAQVGEALGVAELARQRGSSLAEAAWEYAAQRLAYLTGELGVFRWTCPDCGELVSDHVRSGRSPAEDETGHAEGCQRLAAAVHEKVFSQVDPRTGARIGRGPTRNTAEKRAAREAELARLLAAEPHATAARRHELERQAAQLHRVSRPYTDFTVAYSKSVSVVHASIRENARRAAMAGDLAAEAYWADLEARFSQILLGGAAVEFRHS